MENKTYAYRKPSAKTRGTCKIIPFFQEAISSGQVSYLLRASKLSPKAKSAIFVFSTIFFELRFGQDNLPYTSMLSGHRFLYSVTANNIFTVTIRTDYPFVSSI